MSQSGEPSLYGSALIPRASRGSRVNEPLGSLLYLRPSGVGPGVDRDECAPLRSRSSSPSAGGEVTMSDAPQAVVRALLRAWGSPEPDVDEVASFLSDDVEYFDSGTGVHHGIEAAKDDLRKQIATGFEDNTIEVRSLVA